MNVAQVMAACRTDSTTAGRWIAALEDTMQRFGLTDPLQRSAFLAQVGYESCGLTRTEENLNYRADRLLAVFPRYFDEVSALGYEHDPVRIANHVYANRMGNRDESSGDGWTFRGRGLIQTTGHDNYLKVEQGLKIPCVSDPDLLLEKAHAADSAGLYWISNGLDKLALVRDIDSITRGINGKYASQDTMTARRNRYEDALRTFGL